MKDKYKLIRKGGILDAVNAPQEDLIANLIHTNTFDVDLDSPIYRIFQLEYFLEDLKNQTLTYCKPSPEAWGDDYEAFLSRVRFFITGVDNYSDPGSVKQYPLSMKPALDNYFALCWTAKQSESTLAWDDFSYNKEAIRLKTTPRKLLSSAINPNDKFYSLSHFLGAVDYMQDDEFEELFTSTPYENHLDSLGIGLAKSFFVLGESYAHEQEVRLLYAHHPNDNDWVQANVKINDGICAIPFDWHSVVEDIVLCPDGVSASSLSILNKTLQQSNIFINPRPSTFTTSI